MRVFRILLCRVRLCGPSAQPKAPPLLGSMGVCTKRPQPRLTRVAWTRACTMHLCGVSAGAAGACRQLQLARGAPPIVQHILRGRVAWSSHRGSEGPSQHHAGFGTQAVMNLSLNPSSLSPCELTGFCCAVCVCVCMLYNRHGLYDTGYPWTCQPWCRGRGPVTGAGRETQAWRCPARLLLRRSRWTVSIHQFRLLLPYDTVLVYFSGFAAFCSCEHCLTVMSRVTYV